MSPMTTNIEHMFSNKATASEVTVIKENKMYKGFDDFESDRIAGADSLDLQLLLRFYF